MPTRPKAHKIGAKGTSIFSKFINDKGWIIRDKQDQNDYGIDCEVEIVEEDGTVTGNIFYCQLKSAEKLKWSSSREDVRVTSKVWEYWFDITIPVIVILVDTHTEEIFWNTPFKAHPKKKSVLIKFKKDSLLNSDFSSLEFYIYSWKRGLNKQSAIQLFPTFHKAFIELMETAKWTPDAFYANLEENDYLKFSFFYEYVQQLNLVLGLDRRIVPLHFWVRRSNFATKDNSDPTIVFEVFQEALMYLVFFYVEAFEELKKRLNKNADNLGEYVRSIVDLDKPSKQRLFYGKQRNKKEELEFNAVMEQIMDNTCEGIKKFKATAFKDRDY